MTVRKKSPSAPASGVRPFVAPSGLAKSGCMNCPLAAFHADFATFAHRYQKDAEKLQGKLKIPHCVASRNVAEPWTEVDVLVVSDVPGSAEDKTGLPFTGRHGDWFREAVVGEAKDGVLAKYRVGYTFMVRCATPLGRDVSNTEVNACSGELIREIKARKPKLIIACGGKPLTFLTGQTGILNMSGKLVTANHPELPEIPVLPSLTPGYVLKFDHELDRFLDSLKVGASFLDGTLKQKSGKGKYHILTDIVKIEQLIDRFEVEKGIVAFDTETGSLSPFDTQFPGLLCVSFSDKEGVGYVIPLDHKDSPFRPDGELKKFRPRILTAMRKFFLSTRIKRLAQNEKFDRKHLRKYLGCDIGVTAYDTMLTHMLLDERRGSHGLKSMAYAATGMGGYEAELDNYIAKHPECDPDKGGSYANIPGELLFLYGAMDADVTVRVLNWLRTDPQYTSNKGFQNQAEVFLPQLSATLARMEYAGAQVDSVITARIDAELEEKIAAAEAKINADPMVQRFVADHKAKLEINSPKRAALFEFNPGSTDQLRAVLFDYYKVTPTGMTDKGLDVVSARWLRECEAVAAENEKSNKPAKPEPIFQDFIKQAVAKREWDLFTTDADALNTIARLTNNPLVEHILEYREHSVMRGTFIHPLQSKLDENGRVHGNFNLGGTVTGRLSSSDPNLQNIGGVAKECYVSRFGEHGLLLQADYSQIELRIAASWYNEPKMKEAYRKGIDLHYLTSVIISGLTAEAFKLLSGKDKKAWRGRAKRVNFGSLYGGGPPALQSTLRKDGVYVTIEECVKFLRDFFKGYPGLAKGMEETKEFCLKNGYLQSFTGRRRRFPEVASVNREIVARALRQGINFPIQGSAGEMTLMALTLIDKLMRAEGFKSMPVLTVHDSIVFDCHVDEVFEVAKLAKRVMENLPSLSEDVLPGLNWKWLDVPIVAEFECGPTWGKTVEFDPVTIQEGKEGEGPVIGPDEKGKPSVLRKPANVDELWEIFAFNAEAA